MAAMFLLIGVLFAAPLAGGPGGDERVLLDLTRQLGQAWATKDTVRLEALIDDPYFHTDVNGRTLDRTSWLAEVPKMSQAPEITFQDMKVQLYGDMAVITGENMVRVSTEGASARGLRFTQVWRRHGASWRRAVFQATWIAGK